jgi:hypothetical protein
MGEPSRSNVLLFPSEYIGWIKETRGSETSQYPKEEKTKVIPLVVASESGRGQTDCVPSRQALHSWGCGT